MRGGLIGLAAAVVLAGCGSRGRPDALPGTRAHRVICATPAVAEIVFALGAGDRVAGVSEFTDWPPEAVRKPSIGGALAPNRERILALKPDLILAQGRAEALGGFARAQGIAFLSLPLDTLPDVRAAIAGFAEALGVPEAGQDLLNKMGAELAAISPCGPVPVFIALGHVPGDLAALMTAGPGTFLSQIAGLAGGSNVFSDVQVLWPRISQEALVRRQPALILDIQAVPTGTSRRAALLADWARLGLPPGRVRILEEDYLLKPGPRAAHAAACIAAAICP